MLQPVYTLAILNKNFDAETEEFYHRYQLINRQNTDEVIEGLEMIFVELQKFKPESLIDRKIAVLWLRFLKEVNEENALVSDELLENPDICRAVDICEKGGFTDAELAIYDKYWDNISTEISVISNSFREGKAEGKAEVVIESHKAGLPVDTIAVITRLTPDQITSILKDYYRPPRTSSQSGGDGMKKFIILSINGLLRASSSQ